MKTIIFLILSILILATPVYADGTGEFAGVYGADLYAMECDTYGCGMDYAGYIPGSFYRWDLRGVGVLIYSGEYTDIIKFNGALFFCHFGPGTILRSGVVILDY